MELKWLGRQRDTIEAIFLWSNHYAPRYKKPFRITDEVSLSASEIQVVEYLLENEELQLNMAGVARRLGISASAFTALVAKLEKMGLVEKYYHEGNRKNLIVLVTEQGRFIYGEYARQLCELWQGPVLDRLAGIPEKYQKLFAQALQAMAGVDLGEPIPPASQNDLKRKEGPHES